MSCFRLPSIDHPFRSKQRWNLENDEYLSANLIGNFSSHDFEPNFRQNKINYYEREDLQVPFNTPETLSSSSSGESSPEMPLRKEKILEALKVTHALDDDDEFDHLGKVVGE